MALQEKKQLRAGLIGSHLSHSFSPQIHAALADYEYRLFELEASELGNFLTKHDFDALNVTAPYKKDVIPYLARLSDAAARIGAPTLPGTGEPKKFNFYFQQAEEEASFRQPFSIMDIPGGWINPNNRISDEMEKKWEAFKEHLHESRLLFVPIDATLIMEYGIAA